MPTYFLHGFRWHRQNIRLHVIRNDLEDATPEWLIAPATSLCVLDSFYTLFDFIPPSNPPALASPHTPTSPIHGDEDEEHEQRPETPKIEKRKSVVSLRSPLNRKSQQPSGLALVDGNETRYSDDDGGQPPGSAHQPNSKPEKLPNFNDWSVVKLVEQYDPSDMKAASQPYAYVADYMVEVSLGVAVAEETGIYETKMKRKDNMAGWLEKLRDGLQSGEDIGWYVVVCGDEERASPSMESIGEVLGGGEDEQLMTTGSAGFHAFFKNRDILHEN